MTRYFKCSDGVITVFRATTNRCYVAARFRSINGSLATTIEFHGRHLDDDLPAIEITARQFDALNAAKNERVRAAGIDMRWATSPQFSWVRNADLGAECSACGSAAA